VAAGWGLIRERQKTMTHKPAPWCFDPVARGELLEVAGEGAGGLC
jgi:hypothetical protein